MWLFCLSMHRNPDGFCFRSKKYHLKTCYNYAAKLNINSQNFSHFSLILYKLILMQIFKNWEITWNHIQIIFKFLFTSFTWATYKVRTNYFITSRFLYHLTIWNFQINQVFFDATLFHFGFNLNRGYAECVLVCVGRTPSRGGSF